MADNKDSNIDKATDRTTDKMVDKAERPVEPDPRQGMRKSWQWTSTELKRALDHWDVMADEVHGPSPDEKILQDMQKLLVEIKGKIDSLSK